MQGRAIFFDVDGTLYDRSELLVIGIPLVVKHWKMLLSYRKVRHFLHKKMDPVPGGREGFLNFQADQQLRLCKKRSNSKQKILDWRAEFIVDFDQLFTKIAPPPHIVSCLDQCRNLGFRMGLLTDLPLCRKIERLGLSGYWKIQICSEDLGILKPNTCVFLHAAKMIGVDPESIIFVGDHYRYDILGARSAGMKTAHYTNKKIVNTEADFTFSDYRALVEKLKQWA